MVWLAVFRTCNVRAAVDACDCTRGGCTDIVRETALKADSGRNRKRKRKRKRKKAYEERVGEGGGVKIRNRQTDGEACRQAGMQTDTQTDRETE